MYVLHGMEYTIVKIREDGFAVTDTKVRNQQILIPCYKFKKKNNNI